MRVEHIYYSIVVAGKEHNPSLLNPDFLALRKIVPKEWGWTVIDTITTPPLAAVHFSSGVSVRVEPQRLEVTGLDATTDPTASKAAQVAQSYVSTLPHVRYGAVGINFRSVVRMDLPEEYLKERFLKSGPWISSIRPLRAVGLRFVYPLADTGQINLALDPARLRQVGGEQEDFREEIEEIGGVVVNANFHRDCIGYPAEEQVLAHLQHVSEDWSAYMRLLADFVTTNE